MAYDGANRLTGVTQAADSYAFAYRWNGVSRDRWGVIGCESDRVSQIVNGAPTNCVLDLAAGLTQVLSDGAITYLSGADRML